MTGHTTRRYNDGEVLSGAQRRRRWTPEEKVRIVEETYLPGMRVSLVARRHGIGAGQLFTWRRLMAQGALTDVTGRSCTQMLTAGNVQRREGKTANTLFATTKKNIAAAN